MIRALLINVWELRMQIHDQDLISQFNDLTWIWSS